MGSKKGGLENIWVANELKVELSKLQQKMKGELGEGNLASASRILASAIKKTNLIEDLEFLNVQRPQRKGERITFDWGFRL